MKHMHVEGYPQAMIDGLKSAWGLVLGLFGAAVLGLIMVIAIALERIDSFEMFLAALLLPISMLVDGAGPVILALLAASVVVFLCSYRFKIEALLAICILIQVRGYTLLFKQDQWPRATLGYSITVALYALIRFGPGLWRRWREAALSEGNYTGDDPQ